MLSLPYLVFFRFLFLPKRRGGGERGVGGDPAPQGPPLNPPLQRFSYSQAVLNEVNDLRHPIIFNDAQPMAKLNRFVKLMNMTPVLTIFVLPSSVYSTKDAPSVLLLVDT